MYNQREQVLMATNKSVSSPLGVLETKLVIRGFFRGLVSNETVVLRRWGSGNECFALSEP